MPSFTYTLKRVSQHPLINICIKCFILTVTLFYVYHSLNKNGHTIGQIIGHILTKFSSPQFFYVLLPVILIPVNWGLEAIKWQLLALKVEKISFSLAFQGILTGLTLGMITPHTLGDYAGRIWQLEGENRHYAIASIWLGRLSQLYITLLSGSVALICFLFYTSTTWSVIWVVVLLTALHGAILILLFFRTWCIRKLLYLPAMAHFSGYLNVLTKYSNVEITSLVSYAALRYMVFSFQFYLILVLFGISLHPFTMLTGIALVFLSKSIIPTFSFLADLGIRETAALYFFGIYGAEAAQIVAASLSLWLLNILIPALFGSLLVLKLKITS